jgi:hypothetical protein
MQPKRETFQEIVHVKAVERLDRELRRFIHSIPFDQTRRSAASIAVESDPLAAERIYSRSDIQRYLIQRLAAELHGPVEQSREVHPFSLFKEVLSSPSSSHELHRLDPKVVEQPQGAVEVQQSPTGQGYSTRVDHSATFAATNTDTTAENRSPPSSQRRVLLDTGGYPNVDTGEILIAHFIR